MEFKIHLSLVDTPEQTRRLYVLLRKMLLQAFISSNGTSCLIIISWLTTFLNTLTPLLWKWGLIFYMKNLSHHLPVLRHSFLFFCQNIVFIILMILTLTWNFWLPFPIISNLFSHLRKQKATPDFSWLPTSPTTLSRNVRHLPPWKITIFMPHLILKLTLWICLLQLLKIIRNKIVTPF